MTGEAYAVPAADLLALSPELLLTGAGVLVLLFEAFAPRLRAAINPLAILGVAAAGWAAWSGLPSGPAFGGLIEATPVTLAVSEVVLLATLICLLASPAYLRREGLVEGEYHALLLWSAAGMLLLARSTELLTLFVALELLSICLYSLAAYHRRLSLATEAALKYFLMGAFVSAFVLLGIALLYGETGSTRLADLAPILGADASATAVLGLLLLLAGFAFKMSLAPFHAWAPDAYQGAPSPFVAFLSVAPKAASAVVLVRLLEVGLAAGADVRWSQLVALLALVSMAVGNVLAVVQRDLKRMLAYSGVAHMGYLLVPLVALERAAWEPILVYLVAYALMNAGAFALVSILYSEPGEQHLISDLAGWGYRQPFLAACLAVTMLSLGGIPPTLGFIAKYMVFLYAIEHGGLGLALAIVVTSLVGVFYYLRVVYTLYMRPEIRAPRRLALDLRGRLAATVAAGGSLVLGVVPAGLLEWVARAVRALP